MCSSFVVRAAPTISRIKKGHPGSIIRSGIFFCFRGFAMRRSSCLICCLLLFWPFPSFAEQGRPPVRLETVVVTAQKSSADQTGDVGIDSHSAFTSVINREAFEGRTESLADVIEKESGVQVRRSGGIGSFSSVSLRGASSDQVMVFVDGILLNDASGGGVDLSHIALSDVEAIEIYRGVTPIHFGKASLGGMVNIRTRRARTGFNATASAGYGSFETRSASAFVNHKPGRWDYLLSADYLASDNDFKFLNDGGTQWNTADDRREKRLNAQMEQYAVLGKIGYDIGKVLRFDLTNQYFDKEQGLPSWNNSPATRTRLDTLRNITTARMIANDLTALGIDTRTQITYLWKEEVYDDREGHIGLGRQHNTYTTDRLGADFFAERLSGRHALIFSAGASEENYEAYERLNRRLLRDSRRGMLTLGVQDTISFWHERLLLIPAVRYTWIRDDLKAGVDAQGTSLGRETRRDEYLSPQIGLQLKPLAWLTLQSNLARYVREPSFYELYGDRGFFIGNPELRSEEGTNSMSGLSSIFTCRTPGCSASH
jgi:outer membrane receptor protein involved in Fe transport